MATIQVVTSPEEQQKIYSFIQSYPGIQMSVAAIAKQVGLPQTRVRYALDDLVTNGFVVKVPTRQFNSKYIRYSYQIGKEFVNGTSYSSEACTSHSEG